MQKIQAYSNNNYSYSPAFGFKLTKCIFHKTQEMLIKSIRTYRNAYMDYVSQSNTDKLILNDKINQELHIINKEDLAFSLNSQTKKGELITYSIDKQDKIWISRIRHAFKFGSKIGDDPLKKRIYVITDMNFKYAKVNPSSSMEKLGSECTFIGKIILNKRIQKCLKDLMSLKNRHFTSV